jgi:DNA-binding protein WhiA
MSLLAAWGASNSLVSLEELQLERDMDNQVNRSVNAELGNLQRETRAVDELRAAFDRTDRTCLSPRTMEVVQARLRYPDLPLSKLANKIPGCVSKSTIHYHIAKVLRNAQ